MLFIFSQRKRERERAGEMEEEMISKRSCFLEERRVRCRPHWLRTLQYCSRARNFASLLNWVTYLVVRVFFFPFPSVAFC